MRRVSRTKQPFKCRGFWFGAVLFLGFLLQSGWGEVPTAKPVPPELEPGLVFTEVQGETGVEADYLSEKTQRDEGNATDYRNVSAEEYVRYKLNGYVYHPRFLDIRSRLKFGLLQQWISRSGDDTKSYDDMSNTALREYDIYLRFLKDHALSFDVFARRNHDVVRELFSDQISLDSEDIGAILRWKKQPFPMELSLRQNRLWQDGFDSRSRTVSRVVEYTIRNELSKRIRSSLRYRYRDYDQHYEGDNGWVDVERDTRLQTHDLNFENMIYLDSSERSYLQSSGRLYRQTGDQDIRTLYWQERLHLQHAPALSSYYLVNFLDNEFDSYSIRNYRAEAGLDHRLFQSLFSHADLHWRDYDYPNADDQEYGVTGRLDYRKSTPWGYLTAGYALTLDENSRGGMAKKRYVVDEPVTLKLNRDIYLAKPNIRPESVVVTDTEGVEIYSQQLDYLIEQRGNRLTLRLPNITGRIKDGQTVLVDYEIDETTDLSYRSTAQDFYLQHDFQRRLEGLSLYYRWSDLTQNGDISESDLSILAYTRHVLGAGYRWRWLNWTEEFERYESNFNSYDQLRSQVGGTHTLTDSVNASWYLGLLNASYNDDSIGRYGYGEDYSDALFAGAALRGGLGSRGYWQLEARGRRETGVTDEMLLGLLGRVGFNWRKMHISTGFQIEDRDWHDSDRQRIHIFIRMSRDL